jgi:hypothetical protein
VYVGSALHTTVDPAKTNYTIFDGTSEIQRLVVARSISGLHIP